MGHIPILLIAGDFLQIKPANEISLADNLEELIRKMPHRVQTEHHAAQAALMSIDTVIHLKKSKRFLDAHLPEITAAMRRCTPTAPLSEDHLAQLRSRKIENCKKELSTDLFKDGHVIGMYWENIARSMVERANRDAQFLDVPLFCLQAADQRHSRKNKAIDEQLSHQLLTVPNPHRTGKLQGMLLVHENMVVRLADVLAPQLGLVKDKLAVVVKVDLHHEDQNVRSIMLAPPIFPNAGNTDGLLVLRKILKAWLALHYKMISPQKQRTHRVENPNLVGGGNTAEGQKRFAC